MISDAFEQGFFEALKVLVFFQGFFEKCHKHNLSSIIVIKVLIDASFSPEEEKVFRPSFERIYTFSGGKLLLHNHSPPLFSSLARKNRDNLRPIWMKTYLALSI